MVKNTFLELDEGARPSSSGSSVGIFSWDRALLEIGFVHVFFLRFWDSKALKGKAALPRRGAENPGSTPESSMKCPNAPGHGGIGRSQMP